MAFQQPHRRTWNPKPRVSNAEDSQPNERRMLPKGAGVPAIRPTQHRYNPYNTYSRYNHPRHHYRDNRSSNDSAPRRTYSDGIRDATYLDSCARRNNDFIRQCPTSVHSLHGRPDHNNTGHAPYRQPSVNTKLEDTNHGRILPNSKKSKPTNITELRVYPSHVNTFRMQKEFAVQEKARLAKERNVEIINHKYVPDGIEILFRPSSADNGSQTTLRTNDAPPNRVVVGMAETLPLSKNNAQETAPRAGSSQVRPDPPLQSLPIFTVNNAVLDSEHSTNVTVKTERESTPVLLTPRRRVDKPTGSAIPTPPTTAQSSPDPPIVQSDAINTQTSATNEVLRMYASEHYSREQVTDLPARPIKFGNLRFNKYKRSLESSPNSSPTHKRQKPSEFFANHPVHVMSPTNSSLSPEIERSAPNNGQRGWLEELLDPNGTLEEELAEQLRASITPLSDQILRFSEDGETFLLPKATNDKPRRILVAQSKTLVTTMYGHIHELYGTPRIHQRQLVCENYINPLRSDDACVLAPPYDTIVVLAREPRSEVDSKDPEGFITLHDISREKRLTKTITDPRNCVSSIATVHALPRSLRFVTGGLEGTKHAIRVWEVNRDLTMKTSELLEIKHTAPVRALLPTGPIGNKLLSGGDDRNVNAYDIAGKRNIVTVKCSNRIHHIHPTSQHDSVLVEVQHRDSQFEVRDLRAFSSKTSPNMRFGYEASGKRANAAIAKGDIRGNTFVFGDDCGIVRVWDLRNTKDVVQKFECFFGPQIVHVKFDDNLLAVCSADGQVKFLDINQTSYSL